MDTDNHYHYSPLSSPRSTRLIMLHASKSKDATLVCNLVEISMDDPPTYEALSYTWGGEAPIEPMTVITASSSSPQSLLLTPNCASALRILRTRIGRRPVAKAGLWIDAVCINQSSIEEKNLQVVMMVEIYRKAKIVVVWLGEEWASPRFKSLLLVYLMWLPRLFDKWSSRYGGIEEWADDVFSSVVEAGTNRRTFENLFYAPYWSRTWTLQEFSNRSAGILCRSSSIFPVRQVKPITSVQRIGIQNLFLHFRLFDKSTSSHISLIANLAQFLRMNASEPRDKVFALRDLLSGSFGKITVDYTRELRDIFTEATRLTIQESGDLRILYQSCWSTRLGDIPSWVVDFASEDPCIHAQDDWLDPTHEFSSNRDEPHTGPLFSNDGVRLCLMGKRIGTVGNCVSERLNPRDISGQQTDADSLRLFADSFCRFLLTAIEHDPVSKKRTVSGVKKVLKLKLQLGFEIGAYDDVRSLFDKHDERDEEIICRVMRSGQSFTQGCLKGFGGGSFFLASDGRVGAARCNVLPGDSVCIFAGLKKPFVVRRKGLAYILVCPAVLDGAMEGEMWPDNLDELEMWEIT